MALTSTYGITADVESVTVPEITIPVSRIKFSDIFEEIV